MKRWNGASRLVSRTAAVVAAAVVAAALATPASGQEGAPDDPVLRAIWDEGLNRSQVPVLAQILMDSIGPRLTGTPQKQAGHDWLVGMYRSWGIEAENEQFGTWKGWRRGPTHVDLVAPRVATLDGMLLGWSPGTDGPVEGPVVALPPAGDAAALERWQRELAGAFVLVSRPEPSCRPLDQWQELADSATLAEFAARRAAAEREWQSRAAALGMTEAELIPMLAEAGAAGLLTSMWSGGYGVRRVFGDRHGLLPILSMSCEHYGLLHRLADAGQGPRLRVDARSEEVGVVPSFNTIATIPGTDRPVEYVMLSAHFDSWDGAEGATDNGTGTIVMLEAMRLLRLAYPNPSRTILVGHWGSEEQGLNGSRAFVMDRPEVVTGLQALFNQDNGTGPITSISMQGLVAAEDHFRRWLDPIPERLSGRITLTSPGSPSGGGTDHASFICAGAPGFSLRSEPWDYFRYTWHTNLDTYDKIALSNVRDNAVLVAMLAYMASEDPTFMDRTRREMPVDERTGLRAAWPECRPPVRSWEGYAR